MRYSIEPRDRIYVKGYKFLTFAKNIGKNLSGQYSQKLFDSAKNVLLCVQLKLLQMHLNLFQNEQFK